MGVQQAQAGKARIGLTVPGQFRNKDAIGFADQNHDRHTLAIDEHAELTTDAATEHGQFAALVRGETAQVRKTPIVQPGYCRDLTGLEAGQIAEGFGSDGPSP